MSALAAAYHEVLLALTQEPDEERFRTLLAEKARQLTQASLVTLAQGDPEGQTLTFTACVGDDAAAFLGLQVGLSDTPLGHTIRTGEPQLRSAPPRAELIVPVFADGRAVGALAVRDRADGGAFTGDDLMMLTTLAAAASARLAATRLRREARRNENELAALYAAVQGISGHLSLHDVLEAVVEQLDRRLDAAVIVVFLADDESRALHVAAERGLPEALRESALTPDAPFVRAVLERQRAVRLPLAPGESPLPGLPVRAGLAAPIRSKEQTHGLILLASQQPPEVSYTESDTSFLQAIASQAAIGIENAKLYAEATRRAEESATLYELSQTFSHTLSLSAVVQWVAQAVPGLLSVDRSALFLQESPDDERLRLAAGCCLPEGAALRLQPALGEGTIGRVWRSGAPLGVEDLSGDPLGSEGVASLVAAPIQSGEETWGVLCALSGRRRLFTVAETELLYTVANQAAVAITNARAYADMRRQSVELRRYFHRAARALGASDNPQESPALIVGLARDITGADRCSLYAVREDGTLSEEFSDGSRVEDDTEPDQLARRVARRGKTLSVSDLEADERFTEGQYARPVRGRFRGYLGVPLHRGETVIGVLEVYTRSARRWERDPIRLMKTFASQAAVAFENTLLRRAAQNRTLR